MTAPDWPDSGSALHVEDLDVAVGVGLLVGGTAFLFWLVGPTAGAVLPAIWSALFLLVTVRAAVRGRRGWGLLLVGTRLSTGLVGRWATP